MYNAFVFRNGANPYITKTNKDLFRIFCKYYTIQKGVNSFFIVGKREYTGKANYRTYQLILQSLAVEWQTWLGNNACSFGDLANWSDFFNEYGKKYGLIREFRENGII